MKKDKVYKANDVARYVIEYCIAQKNPISQIQLQKILYYIQATFLVRRAGRPCFKESILNWSYGPVVREVYDEFKKYGSNPILAVPPIIEVVVDSDFVFKYNKVNFNSNDIEECDKVLINGVVNKYCKEPAFTLVKKTHEEEPWVLTKRNDTISNKIIENYYKNNLNKL